MYEEDGVRLARTEYLELLHVLGYGAQGRRTFSPSQGVAECERLCSLGLIGFYYDSDGGIDEAWVTEKGRKWLASHDESEVLRAKDKRHDYLVVAAGAVAGAVASLVVELVCHVL